MPSQSEVRPHHWPQMKPLFSVTRIRVLLLTYMVTGDGRNVRQLANPLLMRLPAVRGATCCYSPVPSPTEPLGHGDFGPNGSVFFPPSHFTKPTDVSSTSFCQPIVRKWLMFCAVILSLENRSQPSLNQSPQILRTSSVWGQALKANLRNFPRP